MMRSVSQDSIQGLLWSEPENASSDNDMEGAFSARKVVVGRDENRHFGLFDKVDSKSAGGALKKFGKIKTMKQIGVYLKELFKTKSFRQARIAVKDCRLSALNSAIEVSSKKLEDRKIEAFAAYCHINGTPDDETATPEQALERLSNMVESVNQQGIEPGFDDEAVQKYEQYLQARNEMDEMQAAKALLEASIIKLA
ncbi:hypothetical protein [Endozoicomonas lisbonensis]